MFYLFFYSISDLLNPSEKGSYYRIQHVKSGKLLDANSSGDTFLSVSNNSISQIWKWDGKYLANAQNVKNKLCLGIVQGGKLFSSFRSSSYYQRWTITNSNNSKRFQNDASGTFLDANAEGSLFSSALNQLKNPDWNFYAGILNFFVQNNN